MMKTLLFLLLSFPLMSSAACLQDSLVLKTSSKALVDIKKAETAVEIFQDTIAPEIPKDHALIIRLESLNPRVNADIVKNGGEVVIQIMGGMLRHEKMTPDVLMLLLCHEMGHFLGGPPLKSRKGWSSTEGQSDYFSGLKCTRSLGFDEATFIDAALALTSIYAEVGREAPPRLDQCDDRTVDRTNYGYPSVQCRLDTLMSGWSGRERPRCWFNE